MARCAFAGLVGVDERGRGGIATGKPRDVGPARGLPNDHDAHDKKRRYREDAQPPAQAATGGCHRRGILAEPRCGRGMMDWRGMLMPHGKPGEILCAVCLKRIRTTDKISRIETSNALAHTDCLRRESTDADREHVRLVLFKTARCL